MLTPTPTPTDSDRCDRYPDANRRDHAHASSHRRPAPVVRLNEILPRPDAVDWDGDGKADAYDEWIEIINLGPGVADLAGWGLDDILGGGSAPTSSRRARGWGRANSWCATARHRGGAEPGRGHRPLLAADGSVVDSFSYTGPERDASYSRAVDGTGDWTETYPPSPGGPNLPGTPVPSRHTHAHRHADGHPDRGRNPNTHTDRRPATRHPSGSTRSCPGGDVVDSDGSGAVDAYDGWIEVINLDTETIDLGGWNRDDIPGGTRALRLPGVAHYWSRVACWCATAPPPALR